MSVRSRWVSAVSVAAVALAGWGAPGALAEVVPDTRPIAEVQGTGSASPFAGQQVSTEGVVTAVYPTGGLQGYTIQTPGSGGAAGSASDGLFVYSAATAGSVAVGDLVEVTGTVSEYRGLTELTVPSAAGVVQLGDAAVPAPVAAGWPTSDAGREALESMLLLPTGPFTVTDTYRTDQYGTVGLAAGTTPLLQPTEVGRPGSPEAAAAVADAQARGVVLDDGASTNYLNTANAALVPPYVSLAKPVRVGAAATFTAPVVVDYRNDVWTLNPTAPLPAGGVPPATFANTRAPAPDAGRLGAADLRVASFNVLNYFTTLGVDDATCQAYTDPRGDGVTVRGGCDQRGAWDPEDLARQQAKIVSAINALDADVVGLMEIESSLVVDGVADEALATLVGALNAAAGRAAWAYVPSSSELPPVAEQDAIANALIYRPDAVQRSGDSRALGTASADGEAFANAREPLGQVFAPVGGGTPFLVVVNHLKSKGSAGPWPGDADTGDGQGASNESRVRQAEALRDWVPTVQGEAEAVVLVGDFNSYTQEDPLMVLADAGYTDAAPALDPGEYSYSYGGLSGSLDHVLLNAAARDRATGADIWQINAEESVALEYSRYGYHGADLYAPDAYRSSDHDPVIVGLASGARPAGPVDLTLLNLNDFHGRIDANTVKVAGTIEQQRAAAQAAGGAAVLLSAGDNIGASVFASAVAQDQPTIDVLTALGLSASAVGNHELDGGFADLTGRVIAGGNNARWPYLAANVYRAGTTTPALAEYTVLGVGGVEVGVIGAVTQETPTLVSPGGIAGLEFGDPVVAVNRVAAQLSDGNPGNGEADVLVAEYHDGAAAGTPDGATLEQEVAAGGPFAAIVTQTSPAVDVIFTGHTHKLYAWLATQPDGTVRPVVQTGSYGENVGKVELTYDPATDAVTDVTATNVVRTTTADAELVATYPRAADVKRIVDGAVTQAAVVGDQPKGSVTADITTAFTGGSYTGPGATYVGPDPSSPAKGRDDRSAESTLGDLVASSLRDTLASAERGGAQIGVVNPGGLRAELFYAPDGVITYAEANAVLPFVNNLWTTTLTGAQVKTLLEQQWQTLPDGTVPSRPYLQLGLSDNVTYTYDAARTQGDHITSVTVDGAPLDAAASYRIGTFSFLAQGGDNFRVLAQGSVTTDSGLIDRDAWIAYLQAHPNLAPDFARQAVGLPALPATVAPGDTLALPVTGLDLTSVGSPRNASVDVRLDGGLLTTVPAAEGAADASVTVPDGTADGPHTVTLVAAPSGTTVTVPVTVEQPLPASTTTLRTDRTVQVYGARDRVLLTARVESAGSPVAGAVEFLAGDRVLATVELRGGVATYRLPADTAAGELSITARFTGSATVAPSVSDPVAITVRSAASRTTLAAPRHVLREHGWLPGLLVSTVSLDNGRPAEGAVEFREGDQVVARSTVVHGLAVATLPNHLAVGVHTYAAVFVPDDPAGVTGSTSRPVTVRVTR